MGQRSADDAAVCGGIFRKGRKILLSIPFISYILSVSANGPSDFTALRLQVVEHDFSVNKGISEP